MKQDEPLSESELNELEEVLNSDVVPSSRMNISTLHGFLTAIVVGPSVVLPSEWLPVVWGEGKGPKFQSLQEAQRVLDLIMRLNNDIAGKLASTPEEFTPVVYRNEESPESGEDMDLADWCGGFLEGMRMRTGEWEPLMATEEGATTMAPIMALTSDEAFQEVFEHRGPGAERDPRESKRFLAALIPLCVKDFYDYWRPTRGKIT